MRALALSVRSEEGWSSAKVTEKQLRAAFNRRGVEVESWRHFRRLRGAYFQDRHGAVVVINGKLPLAPRVFTLAHELKHHLVDQDENGVACNLSQSSTLVERGAEEFAAELLLPGELLEREWFALGIRGGQCPREGIVRLKASTKTTMSYQALAISVERLGLAEPGAFRDVRWFDVQERMLGHRRHY
jgi:hypothetical protein